MVLPNLNENRMLMEYSTPTVTTSLSCIVYSQIAANNFELKPSFIQMMPSFYGLSTEDPNLHINEFLEICDTLKVHNVTDEAVKLRLFPFSLKDKAKTWLKSFPPNSITTWNDLASKLLQKFFLPSKTAKLRNDIMTFAQFHGEPFYESWERFRDLLLKCPHHGLLEWLQLQNFYQGLSTDNKRMIDAASGGALMTKTVDEAFALFNTLAANSQSWGTDKELPKKAGVHKTNAMLAMAAQISSLNKKFDNLMVVKFVKSFDGVCEICAGIHSSIECLMSSSFPKFIQEQANQVNNFNCQPFDPFSDKYNLGWRHYPNFAWKNNQQSHVNPPIPF
ncbi:uncharacterized protein LOC125468803 [Pyrus x bretschneideri]|uniref:uncharacterized protein LOC125468803 n=1 Tax=Pyrus x bretschneideri TaxID=225117 RepID=UPI00202DE2C6|nr:uncharacterized protein LOC125468803 [Pyrus x bretschneideri]